MAILTGLLIGADYAPRAGSVLVGIDDNVYVTGGTKTGAVWRKRLDVFAAAPLS